MDSAGRANWGLVILGICFFVIGLAFLFMPGITLVTIAIIAGISLLASGIYGFVIYFTKKNELDMSGWVIAYSLCDLLMGVIFLLHPVLTAAMLPWIGGVVLIVAGALEVFAAFGLRGGGLATGGVFVNGAFAVICGIAFLILPWAFVYFIAFFLIARGVMLVLYGLTFKNSSRYARLR